MKRTKFILKHNNHVCCTRCFHNKGSQSSIERANKEAWAHIRKIKAPFSTQEEKLLWHLYQNKHISEAEMKYRMQELKDTVRKNNTMMWIRNRMSKPTFQEEFTKLRSK